MMITMDPYRLPRNVIPTRYELRLTPDLASAGFSGTSTIHINVVEPTTEIVLNAAELQIDQATLADSSDEARPCSVVLEETTERCRVAPAEPIVAGAWKLQLVFRGTLNDRLRGFYRSSYKDAGGATHWLAATQFEATDARRAFPCWDEPAFKAVFATTLVIDPSLTAVSNTAIAQETEVDSRRVIRFADTIPLSTYLVAFVIGELEATAPSMIGPTPLRVWCVPGKSDLAKVGQEIGAFSLGFYEDYYGIPYPGGKLDLLAIPDFAAGAMENLGAITFRETALLVDERQATHSELERVADVVAHENAHMWFGDLVTMEWWNGLWLNEAFATFLEMVAVDAWKPEWDRWTTFGVSRAAAFAVDGLRSTRPIEFAVAAPQDAEAMFDVLTYEKGASVLRMIEQYLGPEVFRAGVREYLRRHAYGNTQTGDLWRALGNAAQQDIPAIMDGWVFHPGYPLVSVALDGLQLVLKQRRFSYVPLEGEAQSQRWQVPVQVRVRAGDKSVSRRLLLADDEARVDVPAGFESVVVNESGHGFYRVAYAGDLLNRLLDHLDNLSGIERFNLVNDAWASVLAGLLPLGEYVDLTARFRGERDKNVWTVLTGSFYVLNRVFRTSRRAAGEALESLVRDRAGPAVAELGWSPKQGERELTRQLRGDLLRALGVLGNDSAVQARAAEVYADYLRRPAELDANVLSAVIGILAHAGDSQRYDEFLGRFRAAKTPQEEQRYLYALAAFRAPDLVEQTLKRTLNGEFRTQDAPMLLRAMMWWVHSREAAWAFLKANWDTMAKAFPLPGLRRMCEGITGLATAELERDVRDFFTSRKISLGGKTLDQYLEQLRVLVALGERERLA
jgi:puromycin-sensitive aminopeptidase